MTASLNDYDFELPDELIAQVPAERRDASRLLILDRGLDRVEHASFPDIVERLHAGDLLVVNDTRVVPARLFGTRRLTGGRVEVLILDPRPGTVWDALVKTRGRLEPGEEIELADGRLVLVAATRHERGRWTLEARPADAGRAPDLAAILEERGRMPLPPYIRRERDDDARGALDRERYQTVYAERPGAVAAPTAGLHFTDQLLDRLSARGVRIARVTLHVGLGTFQPIERDDFEAHELHEEVFHVPEATAREVSRTRAEGGRVVAVGTTSVRSLESAWSEDTGGVVATSGTTRLFLRPGRPLRAVDALLTNFHLPRSSLLLLVAAVAGRDRILAAYREAVAHRYRFYSYGDAMLIL